jgi:hypothetical protein
MDAQDAVMVQNILKLASFAADRLLFCVSVCLALYISHYFLKMFTERTFNSAVHNALLSKSHLKHLG